MPISFPHDAYDVYTKFYWNALTRTNVKQDNFNYNYPVYMIYLRMLLQYWKRKTAPMRHYIFKFQGKTAYYYKRDSL